MTAEDVERAAVELWVSRAKGISNPVAFRRHVREQVRAEFGAEMARLVAEYPLASADHLALYALYREGRGTLGYYRGQVTA